jgi:tRNA G46 methylase TrmB
MWTPPPAPARPSRTRVPGALSGSLLFTRPEHAEKLRRLEAFLAPEGPVALEIGFDHGMCILDRARRFPAIRQLGLEIRARQVERVAPHAPENCLLWHVDARTVIASVLPDARLDTVYAWFPTPTTHGRHLLFTPELVLDLARVLRPGGVVHVKTDVPGYAAHLRSLFAGWPEGAAPPLGEELSRRERVCRRDGIAVVTLCVERP